MLTGSVQAAVQQARLRLCGVRRRLGTQAVQRDDAHACGYRQRGRGGGQERAGADGKGAERRPAEAEAEYRDWRRIIGRGRRHASGDVEQRAG